MCTPICVALRRTHHAPNLNCCFKSSHAHPRLGPNRHTKRGSLVSVVNIVTHAHPLFFFLVMLPACKAGACDVWHSSRRANHCLCHSLARLSLCRPSVTAPSWCRHTVKVIPVGIRHAHRANHPHDGAIVRAAGCCLFTPDADQWQALCQVFASPLRSSF